MDLQLFLYMLAAPVFIVSLLAYVGLFVFYRPKVSRDIDEVYHEFEDLDPKLQRYRAYSKTAFTAAVISALILFVTTYI